MKLFTKSRVANFTAGTVILYSLYAITMLELNTIAYAGLGTLMGFASKHLFDSVSDSLDK